MFKKNKSGKKIKDCLLGFKKNQKGEVLNTRNKEEYMYKVLNHQHCKLFVYNFFLFFFYKSRCILTEQLPTLNRRIEENIEGMHLV